MGLPRDAYPHAWLGMADGACSVPAAKRARAARQDPVLRLLLLLALCTLAALSLVMFTAKAGVQQPRPQHARVHLPRPARGDPASARHVPAPQPAAGAAAARHAAPSPAAALRQAGGLEVWARGPPAAPTAAQQALASLLPPGVLAQLRALCGRCLYRTLTSYVRAHDHGAFTIVLTGDIPAMWTRDSAVQMASYLPRVAARPALRSVIEGAIRAQAFLLLQDPWANAYNPHYVAPASLPKADRQLGRGGWVWTRNWELDSVAYFMNFLWNYHQTPAVWRPEALLLEPQVHDAVLLLLRVLQMEQRHEQLSPYRYSELPREGKGAPSGYTGMVWSAFRPSDDPQKYGYSIPDNAYLWGALKRLQQLNAAVWRDARIAAATQQLMADIHSGIQQYGIVRVAQGVEVYAYEVDGLGGVLADFDDPNLPSLLALPLLGYEPHNASLYAATRARVLSPKTNAYAYEGSELAGLGSPHTFPRYVWPLATAVEALTAPRHNASRQASLLAALLKMAAGNGLLHESVHVDNTQQFSRAEFGWANAMGVVAVEQLLGVDCGAEAERQRLQDTAEREARDKRAPPNGGPDAAAYYAQLEASVAHAA